MKHADAIYDWSPSSRAHRELVSSKLPLEPMEIPRDPWLTPVLIGVAIVVVYFVVQFSR